MADTGHRTFWAVGALYLGLTAVFLWPFLPHLGSRTFTNDSDARLVQWILAWDIHAFLHQPLRIFDANTFAPLPNVLAYAENLIGGALMAAPVFWVSGNLVLAMNVVAVLSIPLSGLGTFLLTRRVGVSVAGAVLAGMVYAFTPPRFLRIEQFQLTTIQWIPFCLAYLHRYFDTGRPRDLRLALLFFTAQALTGGHGGTFLMAGIIAMLAWRFGLGEPLAIARRVADMGIPGALALLPTILVFLPYRSAQQHMGLARTLEGWDTAPASFLATPSYVDNRLLAFMPAWTREHADAYLFPGWVPLAIVALGALVAFARPAPSPAGDTRPGPGWRRLAGVTTAMALVSIALAVWALITGATRLKLGDVTLLTMRAPWRLWIYAAAAIAARFALRRRVPVAPLGTLGGWRRALPRLRTHHVAFYALVTLLCAWLLVGPPWGVWQWVYDWPVLSFIRVPTRFILLGLLGLSVLAGIALDRLTRRGPGAPRTAAVVVLSLCCLGEFAGPPPEGRVPDGPIPAIDHYLATRPGPFTIVEVPLSEPGDDNLQNARNATYMWHSTAHWQKTVNGYSGLRPDGHQALFLALWHFPNADALARLRVFGVTYVVDHNNWDDPATRAEVQARYDAYAGQIELVTELGSDRLYRIK